MQRLEHHLGTQLFVRSKCGVDLTPAGRHLFERAASLSEALAGIAETRGLSGLPSTQATIGVGMSPGIGLLILESLVSRFRHLQPPSILQVLEGNTRELCDKVVDAEVDVALVSGQIDSRHIESEALWREPLFLVAPRGGRGSLPFALPTRDPVVKQLIEEELARLETPLAIEFELCSAPGVKRLIAAGHACSVLPYSAVHEEIAAASLMFTPLRDVTLQRSLIWRKRDKPRDSTVALRALMQDIARSLYGSTSAHHAYVLAP